MILDANQFTGTISTLVGRLSHLNTFSVDNNGLSGRLSNEFYPLRNSLRELALDYNGFEGALPQIMEGMTNLDMIYLLSISCALFDYSPFLIQLVVNIVLFVVINDFGAEYLGLRGMSHITGTIPTEISSFTALSEFSNHFSCTRYTLPITRLIHAILSSTDTLWLLGTGINGTVPTEIGTLTDMTYLSLANTQIKGPIPSQVGMLSNLGKDQKKARSSTSRRFKHT